MLLKKEGFPEESELVLCTVTRIQFNSVFVDLDEYKGKSGMLHISEISPGRIRNIRDYVKEGKKIVCVVLKVKQERGHIDLSLRRVNKNQHRKKMETIKKELKAEKIIELIAKEHNMKPKELFDKIANSIDYEYPADFFEEIVIGETDINQLNLDEKLKKELDETIKQKIKPPTVELTGKYNIRIYEPDGVEKIKKALKKAQDVEKQKISITYMGAGRYEVKITEEDYKLAENLLKKATTTVDKSLKNTKGTVEFKRAK
ncbi:MAG: translation initiation factor IF-2 subunit alpha [Candidatus Nanoarchaeia archaeon]